MRIKVFLGLAAGITALVGATVAVAATPTLFPSGYWGPLTSCSWVEGSQLPPCTSLCDLLQTAQNIIYFGLSVLLFILTPVFLLWGGFMIMFSGSNPGMRSKGTSMIWGAVIGVAIGLGAFVIINTFLYFLGLDRGDPSGVRNIAWPAIQCAVQPPPRYDTGTVVPPGGGGGGTTLAVCQRTCPAGNVCFKNADNTYSCITIPPNTGCNPLTNQGCQAGYVCCVNINTNAKTCKRGTRC
jgi:hypothetical protein